MVRKKNIYEINYFGFNYCGLHYLDVDGQQFLLPSEVTNEARNVSARSPYSKEASAFIN